MKTPLYVALQKIEVENPLLPRVILTLFRMGFLGAAQGWGGGVVKRHPLPKICRTYPTIVKPGTVIPYPKKIQKILESRDILLEFC